MKKRMDKNLAARPQRFGRMLPGEFLKDLEKDKKFTLEQMLTEASRWIPSFASKQERYKVSDEVNERTVRFYIGRGLIDRPIGREGRKAIFSHKHVLQLLTVKFLQSNYIPLKKIADIMAVFEPADLLSLLLGERPLPLALPGLVWSPNSPATSRLGHGRRKRFRIHEKLELEVDEDFDILGEDVDVKKLFTRIMQVLADTAKGCRSAQDPMIGDTCFDDLDWDYASPAHPLRDRREAVVALVTEGGLVPRGNPDKLEPARASRFLRYSIENIEDLKSGEFESIDRGWDRKYVNDDPDRLLPLDVMRDLEKEHGFSKLHPYYYTTTGAGTPADAARKIGRELAAELKTQGVSAVLLTSTWGIGTRCGTAISKEIESAGIPVALISPLVPTALFCGAYRIVPGYAIVHPVGNPSLSPHREKEMRRRIVTAALDSMEIEVTGGRVFNWSWFALKRREWLMRLDVQEFKVQRIEFGRFSCFRDGLLSIRKEELTGLIAEDNRIHGVDVVIVSPGEKTRIANVNDILEPRIKGDDSTGYFPGIFARLFRAGQGRTWALKGCAIMEIGYKQGFYGGIVDMVGEGASLTPYSRTHNVCILAKPAPDVDLAEYGRALKLAGAKVSVYLARTAWDSDPDEARSYDLKMESRRLKDLPKVAYLFQLHSHGDSREPFIYGANSRQYYPTILHPNEILDGAIVCGHYDLPMCMKNTTYSILNHPVIRDLYERHGKDLDFRGVVVAPEPTTMEEIHRTAMMAAGLMKDQLGAEGVIITKEGGGHADVDLMRNCEACEDLGIRTVLMDNEWLGQDGSGHLSLLDMSEKADAIVSVGNGDEIVEAGPVEKVVGGEIVADIKGNLMGSIALPVRTIPGAISQIGLSRITVEVRERSMPAFADMTPGDSRVDLCKRAKHIIETAGGAAGTDQDMSRMVRLLSKICRCDPVGNQLEEGCLSRKIRKNVLSDKRGSQRAIELLLRKLGGKEFDTEIGFPGKKIMDPGLTMAIRDVDRQTGAGRRG